MTFRLVYTARAVRDLNDATDYIAQNAPATAERWFNDFIGRISLLRQNALVHGLAPESDLVATEIRQVIYRTKSRRANRVLYTVRNDTVYILCIRRTGQDLLSTSEIENIQADVDKE